MSLPSQLVASRTATLPARRSVGVRVMMVVRLFYPWTGGTERQAHKLARKLVEKGVAVELVTGWWYRGTPRRELLDNVPVYRNLTLWGFFGVKGLRKLGGYLYIATLIWYLWKRRSDYDVIHVHGLNYHTFAAVLAARLLGKRVIAKLANSGPASDIEKMRREKQLALARFMLPVALRCDRFIAINERIVQELTAAGVTGEKIVELPNGVETGDVGGRSTYVLGDPARLLYVGRLHEQKGLDVLLEAFHRLRQWYSYNVCLDVVGAGPLLGALQSQANRLGISDSVVFWGDREDVPAYLQSADIFILPSRAEGISNALLEAMACGLPVVVSAIPGNTDVIQHGENGLVFPVNESDSLAGNLLLLLEQPALRRRLGEAACRTVEERYSLHRVADRYIDLYRELLGCATPYQAVEP